MNSEIWQYGRGFYKGYTENLESARRIMRWTSVDQCCIYYYPNGKLKAIDFIFSSDTYNRVAEALGLPQKRKSPARIKQGQRLQKVDRIAQDKSSKRDSNAI